MSESDRMSSARAFPVAERRLSSHGNVAGESSLSAASRANAHTELLSHMEKHVLDCADRVIHAAEPSIANVREVMRGLRDFGVLFPQEFYGADALGIVLREVAAVSPKEVVTRAMERVLMRMPQGSGCPLGVRSPQERAMKLQKGGVRIPVIAMLQRLETLSHWLQHELKYLTAFAHRIVAKAQNPVVHLGMAFAQLVSSSLPIEVGHNTDATMAEFLARAMALGHVSVGVASKRLGTLVWMSELQDNLALTLARVRRQISHGRLIQRDDLVRMFDELGDVVRMLAATVRPVAKENIGSANTESIVGVVTKMVDAMVDCTSAVSPIVGHATDRMQGLFWEAVQLRSLDDARCHCLVTVLDDVVCSTFCSDLGPACRMATVAKAVVMGERS